MRELKVINERDIRTDNKIHISTRMHGSGSVVKIYKSLKPQKPMCHGCRENFYNGNNDLGVKECWMFSDAQVVDKVGHSSVHRTGGPDTKLVKTLHCWNGRN